jgi:hypothetical protein
MFGIVHDTAILILWSAAGCEAPAAAGWSALQLAFSTVALRFMGSFDLQPWTRIGAMNLGVVARRQTTAVWLGGKFAALCRDAATGF